MSQPGPDGRKSDGRKCPICGKPVETRYRPFCSKRCADIDLGRWLKGDYAIPVKPAPEDEEDSAVVRREGEDEEDEGG